MIYAIILPLLLSVFSLQTHAVVQRHDKPSEEYRVFAAPDYMVDMPHEGHAVLIHPCWLVTVAHTIFYDYRGKTLDIGSKKYAIEQIVNHPSYRELDKSLLKGDARPLMDFFENRVDLALVKLNKSVSKSIKPIPMYEGRNEQGLLVRVFGRGATGDGLNGKNDDNKATRLMFSFQNIIDGTKPGWLTYSFDPPPQAMALEGMQGAGDSGGASVAYIDQVPTLVGLSSWQYWQGDLALFKAGLYGAIAYQLRISDYVPWIMKVISDANSEALQSPSSCVTH